MMQATLQPAGTEPDSISPECWVARMPGQPAVSSLALDWEDLQVHRFDDLPCHDIELPPTDWHFIAAHLRQPCTIAARWGGRPVRGESVPGNVMVMSAGQDSTWACSHAMDELHIFLNPKLIFEVADEAGIGSMSLIDGVALVDPALQWIVSQLLTELDTPALATRLFAGTIARALALQLLRRHSTARTLDVSRGIEMSTRQLRAATDYIDSHIDQDLLLESISSAAAMSPFRFARAFRKAAGRSPRQYVILRRIERAKELLRRSDKELAEIACLVGFSSQSHFTWMFRRHCGITPGRYRAGRRCPP